MDRAEVIKKVEEHVRVALEGNDASHDWAHIERVRATARRIAADEQVRVWASRALVGSTCPGVLVAGNRVRHKAIVRASARGNGGRAPQEGTGG